MESQSLWDKIAAPTRKKMVWTIWFATWILILLGLKDPIFYRIAVAVSVVHLILFLYLFSFDFRPFPVQLRTAYLLWVTIGTFVPGCSVLMYITMVGLASNLFFGYCPLARMLYLLPWNRREAFSAKLLRDVILTPPVDGPFKPYCQIKL